MRLNLGCGSQPEPGYVNVDSWSQPGVDETWDLDRFPWPWKDGEAERVRAFDVFEHVWYPLAFMRECWRVLQPGGILDLHTTFHRSANAHTDPDHKRACTLETWDYWVPGTYLNQRYGAAYARGCHFQKISIGLTDGLEIAALLKKLA